MTDGNASLFIYALQYTWLLARTNTFSQAKKIRNGFAESSMGFFPILNLALLATVVGHLTGTALLQTSTCTAAVSRQSLTTPPSNTQSTESNVLRGQEDNSACT